MTISHKVSELLNRHKIMTDRLTDKIITIGPLPILSSGALFVPNLMKISKRLSELLSRHYFHSKNFNGA